MATNAELKAHLEQRRKEDAAVRKEIAENNRKMALALKRTGGIITPYIWQAPKEVTDWIAQTIISALGKTEVQKKQAQDIIAGLNAYIQSKHFEQKRKVKLAAKRKDAEAKKATTEAKQPAGTAQVKTPGQAP